MIGVLVVGFAILAGLALWLKRRHRRKVEQNRAVASGFPANQEKRGRSASSAALEDMFGPHQHQDLTQGYNYTTDQRKVLGLAGFGAAIREKSRQSRERRRQRDRSRKGKEKENSTSLADIAARDRSKSRRQRPPDPAKMDARERSRSRKRAQRKLENDPDIIEKG